MMEEQGSAVGLELGVRKQHARLRAALSAGMPRLGWKICVNERRSQERLGLVEPFVGFLNGASCLSSGNECALGTGVFAVEPEIAIRLGNSVGADATLLTARSAIEALAPALEIVNYKLAAPNLESIVESSSFHFGLVLGARRDGSGAPPIGPGCPVLLCNGQPSGTPDPALVPAQLAEVVVLVARFLGTHGEELRAGDLILSGACTNPVRVQVGDEVRAEFGALGSVWVRFCSL